MIKQNVQVKVLSGLHFRPAGELTEIALKFDSDIKIHTGNNEANVKSFLSLLAACIKYDDEVEVICEGTDEKPAIDAVIDFLKNYNKGERS